jgi:hypothetical protein
VLTRARDFEVVRLNRAFGSWLPTSEAGAGAVPGEYSRLSFGLVVAGTFDGVERFTRIDPDAHSSYRGLKPISDAGSPILRQDR